MNPLALVFLAGTGAVLIFVTAANLWVQRAAEGRLYDTVESVPAKPEAIVLGAAVRPGNVPSRALAERLDVALALYRAGKVKSILVSGREDHASGSSEVVAMRVYLRERGIPEEAIKVDPLGVRTFATLARAREVFGLREAILVSTDYHLPRALFLARHFGIDAVAVGARGNNLTSIWPCRLREVAARVRAALDVIL